MKRPQSPTLQQLQAALSQPVTETVVKTILDYLSYNGIAVPSNGILKVERDGPFYSIYIDNQQVAMIRKE